MDKPRTPSKSPARSRKQVRYQRLPEDIAEEEEKDPVMSVSGPRLSAAESQALRESSQVKKHEIYENTYYIPNNKVRVLETPMSSSLTFQMLLYYHFFFNLLFVVVIFTTLIYKMWVFQSDILFILALIIGVLIWFPVELARLNFGYKGNINETVSQMITNC